MKLQKRILRLINEYPCTAEFIADVLQEPLSDVRAELAKIESRGRLQSKTLVTYKGTPKPSRADRRAEKRVIRALEALKVGGY